MHQELILSFSVQESFIVIQAFLLYVSYFLGFEKVVKMKVNGSFLQAHVKFLTHNEANLVIQKINGLFLVSIIFQIYELTDLLGTRFLGSVLNVGFVPQKQKKSVESLRNLVPQNRGDAFLPLPAAEPKITVSHQANEFNPNPGRGRGGARVGRGCAQARG